MADDELEDTISGGPAPDTTDEPAEPATSVPGEAAPDETTPPKEEVAEVEVEEEKPAEVVAETPAPAKPPRVRAPVTVEPDAMDAEFDQAIKDIDADDMLSSGQKAKEKLELKTRWEERTERRTKKAEEAQSSIWQNESARTGVTAEQCENAWTDLIDELNRSGRQYTREYATGIYHERVKSLKPKGGKMPSQDPPKKIPVAGKGQILPKGASAGGRVAAEANDGRTVMDRVRDGDKNVLKEIAEINQGFQAGEM